MCTCFTERKKDIFIAMNFDNNGMPFSIKKDDRQFTVLVDGGRGKYPSFGINSNGTFINNLMVDSNGKGTYRRASKKVTHTSKLSGDVLSGVILPDELDDFLDRVEVVNGPDFSVHNMIVDEIGNVWIIEPGRGNIYSKASESPYYIMSNFSLCDYNKTGNLCGDGADRYKQVKSLLESNSTSMNVSCALQILEAVQQNSGKWITDFSMVYTQKENAVYYCSNREFNNIHKHSFQ